MAHFAPIHANQIKFLTGHRRVPALAALALTFAVAIAKWSQNHRTRRALVCLTDSQLDDVGLTREAALKEARRVFWRS